MVFYTRAWLGLAFVAGTHIGRVFGGYQNLNIQASTSMGSFC